MKFSVIGRIFLSECWRALKLIGLPVLLVAAVLCGGMIIGPGTYWLLLRSHPVNAAVGLFTPNIPMQPAIAKWPMCIRCEYDKTVRL